MLFRSQGIYAYVALTSGWESRAGAELEGALKEQVRHVIGGFATPDVVHVTAGLPKTRSGKIMRRLLKARELGLPEGDLSTLESDER